jgi:hypothetical protein
MLDRIKCPGPGTLMHLDVTIYAEMGNAPQRPKGAPGGTPAKVSLVAEKICEDLETFPPWERLNRKAGLFLLRLALTNGSTAVAIRGCLRIVREPPAGARHQKKDRLFSKTGSSPK